MLAAASVAVSLVMSKAVAAEAPPEKAASAEIRFNDIIMTHFSLPGKSVDDSCV